MSSIPFPLRQYRFLCRQTNIAVVWPCFQPPSTFWIRDQDTESMEQHRKRRKALSDGLRQFQTVLYGRKYSKTEVNLQIGVFFTYTSPVSFCCLNPLFLVENLFRLGSRSEPCWTHFSVLACFINRSCLYVFPCILSHLRQVSSLVAEITSEHGKTAEEQAKFWCKLDVYRGVDQQDHHKIRLATLDNVQGRAHATFQTVCCFAQDNATENSIQVATLALKAMTKNKTPDFSSVLGEQFPSFCDYVNDIVSRHLIS